MSSTTDFDPTTGPRCPVTGLAIERRPEWEGIPLTGSYSVTFRLIGEHVLHVSPRGNAGLHGMPRLYEKRREVLEQTGLTGHPYCEIKNYDGIALRHPPTARRQFVARLRDEYDHGTLVGYWGYGGPRVFRWIMSGTKVLENRPEARVYYARDYDTAIREATVLLSDLETAAQDETATRPRRAAWNYEGETYHLTFEVAAPRILVEHSMGRMRAEDVAPYFELQERVLAETGFGGHRGFVQINDGAQLNQIDFRAQVQYYRSLSALVRRHRCLGVVTCNARGPVAAATRLGGSLFPVPFVIEPDLDRARLRAERLLRERHVPMVRRALTAMRPSREALRQPVMNLVAYAAAMDWESRGYPEATEAPDDPLGPVYNLLRVLKHDFDTMLDEREAMQTRVLQAAKLTSLATLTAGVAHELNSPLTAVLGYAEFLHERTEDPDAIRTAERIQRCAQRMRDIIDQLALFSRSGTSGAARRLDVNASLREDVSLLEPLLERHRVSIETQLAPDLPPIWCDRGHLQSVIHNVIVNSCKAYPDGTPGPRRTISLETSLHGEWVQIRCVDQGVGMPANVADRAFDPFFTTKDVGEGMGLGLFVCHRLVTDNGGRLELDSAPGRGTTVLLSFPRTTREAPTEDAPPAPDDSASS